MDSVDKMIQSKTKHNLEQARIHSQALALMVSASNPRK